MAASARGRSRHAGVRKPAQQRTFAASLSKASALTGAKRGKIKLDDSNPIAVRDGEAAADRIESHWWRISFALEAPHDAANLKA
jgi:hypothetical protein